MGKIYAYCRQARYDEKEMEEQKELVWKYCADRGMKIAHCFAEAGSGLLILDGMKQMLSKLQKGDKVVISEYSRLGRKISNVITIEKYLKNHNVELVVINKPDDAIGPIKNWF